MDISKWFNKRVIKASDRNKEERSVILASIDKAMNGLYEYPALYPFGIFIWIHEGAWFWVDEDMEGDIYRFPSECDNSTFQVLECWLDLLQFAYDAGMREGKQRKVCEFRRFLSVED